MTPNAPINLFRSHGLRRPHDSPASHEPPADNLGNQRGSQVLGVRVGLELLTSAVPEGTRERQRGEPMRSRSLDQQKGSGFRV